STTEPSAQTTGPSGNPRPTAKIATSLMLALSLFHALKRSGPRDDVQASVRQPVTMGTGPDPDPSKECSPRWHLHCANGYTLCGKIIRAKAPLLPCAPIAPPSRIRFQRGLGARPRDRRPRRTAGARRLFLAPARRR